MGFEVGDLSPTDGETGLERPPRFPMEKFMLWGQRKLGLCRRQNGKKIWQVHMVKDLEGKYQIGDIPNLY